jgi:DHA2 family multidrug resistance protein
MSGDQTSAGGESRRGLITAGLMVATFIGALDMTVVNVSLAHMQGSLSASVEQITWVLTSYIVASAMATPLSSWLSTRFGLKTMFLACVGMFTLASLLCGLAVSLPEMVALRALQGIAFAPITPLAQAVLLRINPPERHGRAMAAFSMATVAAPMIGPVFGGYLTEQLSWRWCFFINLPTGLVSLVLIGLFMPKDVTAPRRFDFLGFGSLAIAIGALQLLLDRGPSQDWLGSPEIWVEAIVAMMGFWVFVTHTVTARDPLFSPTLVRDRNFVVGTATLFLLMVLLFGSIALLPIMMQNLMGYPATTSGLTMLPRGAAMIVTLFVVGRLDMTIDRRLMAAIGLVILTASFWQMSKFDLSMGSDAIIVATIVQGIGQGVVTVPLTTLALATIAPLQRTDASTVLSLLRNLGGSVGVATMQALMIFNGQTMHASLAEQVTPDDPVVQAGLAEGARADSAAAVLALNDEITRQASMVAFVNNYWLMIVIGVVCVPMVLIMRKPILRRS